MKNVILLTATLVMFAKPFWPIVDYVVNYDYIVNTLCENKERPEMECNGKCHLSKELAKENGDSNTNPLNNKSSKSEIPQILISQNLSEFIFQCHTENSAIDKIAFTPIIHSSNFILKILHPPRLG